MRPGGTFILDFSLLLLLKAILRSWLVRQAFLPLPFRPVAFVKLNFGFPPLSLLFWLVPQDFTIQKTLTLSHFRIGWLKRIVPTGMLVFLDSILQWTGMLWQLTPSVFVKALRGKPHSIHGEETAPRITNIDSFFKCPDCGYLPLENRKTYLECYGCRKRWEVRDGIYDFREPMK